MDVFAAAARLMQMDDRVWRRHANPWSGWTRLLTAMPLLGFAGWSRVWVGGWAWGVFALVCLWIWANPRLFPEPARFDSWMSRGVLGERIFLTCRREVPADHRRVAHVLSALSLPGLVLMLWGLLALWWEGVVFGGLLAMLPKIWFLDRMVWLYEDWRRAGRPVPGMEDADV